MKLVTSLAVLFFTFNIQACRLKRPIVNLSGPLSFIVAKLGLKKDPNLKGVSNFFYREDETKKMDADLLLGGIFMSPKEIKKYKDSVFLIDESKELRSQLKKLDMRVDELSTRNLNPLEAIDASIQKMKPYVEECEGKFKIINKYTEQLLKEVHKIKWRGREILFFLGKIKKQYPQTLMNYDGFTKYLRDSLGVKGYPSKVAYSGWSQKKLKKMINKDTIMIGLVADKDYEHSTAYFERVTGNKWNATGRYLLVPGFGQLKFMSDLALYIWSLENNL